MIYRARKQQLDYGRPIGIMALEEHIPCPPGVPGNPTTFDFPVCYEIVRGVSAAELVHNPNPDPEPFIAAGQALVGGFLDLFADEHRASDDGDRAGHAQRRLERRARGDQCHDFQGIDQPGGEAVLGDGAGALGHGGIRVALFQRREDFVDLAAQLEKAQGFADLMGDRFGQRHGQAAGGGKGVFGTAAAYQ